MGILDRLKLKPRWKHADPAVRLRAVSELDDAIELATLAEHDPDAMVRTATIAKVVDPVVLGRVATSDTEPGARDAAADQLLALALDASNPDAAAAAGQLSDTRRVSQIAKSTAADAVREIALSRLTDERALGGVARQAQVKSTALAAVTRLGSADELLATALNSDHAAVALAAFDRVVPQGGPGADVELLKTVATRSRKKAVARRAKAMLQEIEDAEQARLAAEEKRRNEEARLCSAVESLARLTDPDHIAGELANLNEAWNTLASTNTDAKRRFDESVDAARLHIAERRSEIAAALEETRRRDEALASREALCKRIETDEGEMRLEQLRATEEEWAQLEPVVGYEREVEQIAARFAAAAKASRKRLVRETAREEARSGLEALVAKAESLSTGEKKGAAKRCRTLVGEARELAATLNDASSSTSYLLDRLALVEQALEAHDKAAREAAAKAATDRVTKLTRLAARASQAVQANTITLREGEKLLRDVTTALENTRKDEATKELGDALASLRTSQEPIALRVKELRELEDWRRFGNAARQEELIAMAEAIVATLKAEEEAGTASDLAATAKALRELQAQWQKVADAPRDVARQLWERFKAATDLIRASCEVHFAQVRQERSANLAAKTALVAEAEALVDSTEWSKTAARFQEMQKAWEDIGPASGKSARSLAPRFRAACNTFFTRRRDDLSSRKVEWDANLAGKEALCERAEQLAESTDWETTASAMKALQVEWKAIGAVQRAKSEVVWNRFRAAADKFFDRYHKRHEVAAAAQLAEREALVVELEGLAALEEAPEDLADQVQGLRTTIASAPTVEGAAATGLHERWKTALAALASRSPAAFAGTDLDLIAIRERMERLIAKIESLVEEEEAPAQATDKPPAELLAERLQSALESNAMGVRPDENKWRAAGKAVEEAQATWQRLVWLPVENMSLLENRFEAACKRVTDEVKRHVDTSSDPNAKFAEGGPGNRSGRNKRPRNRR